MNSNSSRQNVVVIIALIIFQPVVVISLCILSNQASTLAQMTVLGYKVLVSLTLFLTYLRRMATTLSNSVSLDSTLMERTQLCSKPV